MQFLNAPRPRGFAVLGWLWLLALVVIAANAMLSG